MQWGERSATHVRGGSGSATRRGGGARGEYDGALEEVAAPAATAAKKRPGADSDESARAGQHALHDDDARRTVQRLGDDAAAAAAAAAAARTGAQRSNRQQHGGLAAAPRDSDPCELASTLETQDASQDSADVSTPLNSEVRTIILQNLSTVQKKQDALELTEKRPTICEHASGSFGN